MSDAAVAYNSSKAGVLWQVADLPLPLRTLNPSDPVFAAAVRTLQAQHGLPADGKLGPGTLAALKAPPAAPAAPATHSWQHAKLGHVRGPSRDVVDVGLRDFLFYITHSEKPTSVCGDWGFCETKSINQFTVINCAS
jgi:peptidoglycan hydrolase-like protein with peptidoglycan-binding domain